MQIVDCFNLRTKKFSQIVAYLFNYIYTSIIKNEDFIVI